MIPKNRGRKVGNGVRWEHKKSIKKCGIWKSWDLYPGIFGFSSSSPSRVFRESSKDFNLGKTTGSSLWEWLMSFPDPHPAEFLPLDEIFPIFSSLSQVFPFYFLLSFPPFFSQFFLLSPPISPLLSKVFPPFLPRFFLLLFPLFPISPFFPLGVFPVFPPLFSPSSQDSRLEFPSEIHSLKSATVRKVHPHSHLFLRDLIPGFQAEFPTGPALIPGWNSLPKGWHSPFPAGIPGWHSPFPAFPAGSHPEIPGENSQLTQF